MTDPIRPTDRQAIDLARSLISAAHFGALAVLHPETRAPHVSRIAIATGPSGQILTLISELSLHTKALEKDPACCLLLGEPGTRGDPLTHPRISLSCQSVKADKAALKSHYLTQRPKAKLYYDFADFCLFTFTISSAELNGGFGKAYHLTAQDLGP